jgi:hypothetical protein
VRVPRKLALLPPRVLEPPVLVALAGTVLQPLVRA